MDPCSSPYIPLESSACPFALLHCLSTNNQQCKSFAYCMFRRDIWLVSPENWPTCNIKGRHLSCPSLCMYLLGQAAHLLGTRFMKPHSNFESVSASRTCLHQPYISLRYHDQVNRREVYTVALGRGADKRAPCLINLLQTSILSCYLTKC